MPQDAAAEEVSHGGRSTRWLYVTLDGVMEAPENWVIPGPGARGQVGQAYLAQRPDFDDSILSIPEAITVGRAIFEALLG